MCFYLSILVLNVPVRTGTDCTYKNDNTIVRLLSGNGDSFARNQRCERHAIRKAIRSAFRKDFMKRYWTFPIMARVSGMAKITMLRRRLYSDKMPALLATIRNVLDKCFFYAMSSSYSHVALLYSSSQLNLSSSIYRSAFCILLRTPRLLVYRLHRHIGVQKSVYSGSAGDRARRKTSSPTRPYPISVET